VHSSATICSSRRVMRHGVSYNELDLIFITKVLTTFMLALLSNILNFDFHRKSCTFSKMFKGIHRSHHSMKLFLFLEIRLKTENLRKINAFITLLD
jgi:hypothetical protein